MNLLQHETSPYLLQHANNPVHWQAWSEAAFEQAKAQNKPVLLSIGYSSCHWCHVMEHESFEDEEVAEIMNNLFINIKLDREEYPDIDHLYMDAVQAMTGSGGWPLNVFLTPDKKPFYGGTYFPPVRAFNRASWKEVLINVSQYFTQNRDEVETQAQQLLQHLRTAAVLPKMPKTLQGINAKSAADVAHEIFQNIMKHADTEYGGFGNAPKFPSTFAIKFLLDYYGLFKNEVALQHACLCLSKMAMGGIYDQIGGGFSRYSTDKFWIAPHFEKMLYDNALLIEVYSIAYSSTKDDFYKEVVAQTVEWLQREMMNEEFGFFCAQDADSEGIEGKFYTWKTNELKTLLKEDFEFIKQYYHITDEGNFGGEHGIEEKSNILFTSSIEKAKIDGKSGEKLKRINNLLFETRSKRIRPMTDDKILLGWNALMNKALVVAYLVFQEENYLELAIKNMDFMLEKMGGAPFLFFHTRRNQVSKIPAYLDDLAYLADALIQLSIASAHASYLIKAKEILQFIELHFKSPDEALFNYCNNLYQQIGIPKKDTYDGALPASNSVLCKVMHHLAYVFENTAWTIRSKEMRDVMMPQVLQYPTSFGVWADNFLNSEHGEQQISIVGAQAKEFVAAVYNNKYLSNVLFVVSDKDENQILQLNGKNREGATSIYVCKNNACLSPFTSIEDGMAVIF